MKVDAMLPTADLGCQAVIAGKRRHQLGLAFNDLSCSPQSTFSVTHRKYVPQRPTSYDSLCMQISLSAIVLLHMHLHLHVYKALLMLQSVGPKVHSHDTSSVLHTGTDNLHHTQPSAWHSTRVLLRLFRHHTLPSRDLSNQGGSKACLPRTRCNASATVYCVKLCIMM
jgi:hypothetical protein